MKAHCDKIKSTKKKKTPRHELIEWSKLLTEYTYTHAHKDTTKNKWIHMWILNEKKNTILKIIKKTINKHPYIFNTNIL